MPASIASKLKKKKRERKEERHLFHGKANWNCCLSSEELLCGEARVHLWANPSAYVIGVDKLHVEVSLGYHGNLKGGEFWFSGSQQKDISVCCVTGLCRGERRRQKCIGKLLSDEFWPASDMVCGLVRVLLSWCPIPTLTWGAWAHVCTEMWLSSCNTV